MRPSVIASALSATLIASTALPGRSGTSNASTSGTSAGRVRLLTFAATDAARSAPLAMPGMSLGSGRLVLDRSSLSSLIPTSTSPPAVFAMAQTVRTILSSHACL